MSRRQAFHELLRVDLHFFVGKVFRTLHPGGEFLDNWHVEAMCWELTKVFEGQIPRLLITLPPRYLKSVCVNVAFPAWVLGHRPQTKLLSVSYAGELASEHSNHFRRVVEADWYRETFPEFEIDRNNDGVVGTTLGGFRRGVSFMGSITGFGADTMIVDDLMKAGDAHSITERARALAGFRETLVTRLNNKNTGSIIVVGQRLHEQDVPGVLIESGTYTHLNLPAIAVEDAVVPLGPDRAHVRKKNDVLHPAHENAEALDRTRLEMGPQAFEAQYQQNPGASDAGVVRAEDFKTYEEPLERNRYQRIVQSWDIAQTTTVLSDFSVGITFGYSGEGWHVLDVVRGKWAFPELVRQVRRAREKWSADDLLIERGGAGTALLQELGEERQRNADAGRPQTGKLIGYRPKLDKKDRLAAQVGKMQEGLVRFPAQAPWMADLRREFLAFPDGLHDDQVDAFSQALDQFVRAGLTVRLERGNRRPPGRVRRQGGSRPAGTPRH